MTGQTLPRRLTPDEARQFAEERAIYARVRVAAAARDAANTPIWRLMLWNPAREFLRDSWGYFRDFFNGMRGLAKRPITPRVKMEKPKKDPYKTPAWEKALFVVGFFALPFHAPWALGLLIVLTLLEMQRKLGRIAAAVDQPKNTQHGSN